MSRLFSRLFIAPLEQEEEERQAIAHEVELAAGFTSHPYFEKVLKALSGMEYDARPRLEDSDKTYSIGVRDGIERARLYLESVAKQVREFRNE